MPDIPPASDGAMMRTSSPHATPDRMPGMGSFLVLLNQWGPWFLIGSGIALKLFPCPAEIGPVVQPPYRIAWPWPPTFRNLVRAIETLAHRQPLRWRDCPRDRWGLVLTIVGLVWLIARQLAHILAEPA